MRLLACCFLRLAGWKIEGSKPEFRHYVFVSAPHTSNWDLVYMVAITAVLRIRPRWLGKHTLFKPPFGWLMYRLGGIPINRKSPGNYIKKAVKIFEANDELALAIPPEGTRQLCSHWKSGFYHIAKAADVPIVLGYLDYGRRIGGVGPVFRLTGVVSDDMNVIRNFYARMQGRYPNQFSTIILREEQQTPRAGHE